MKIINKSDSPKTAADWINNLRARRGDPAIPSTPSPPAIQSQTGQTSTSVSNIPPVTPPPLPDGISDAKYTDLDITHYLRGTDAGEHPSSHLDDRGRINPNSWFQNLVGNTFAETSERKGIDPNRYDNEDMARLLNLGSSGLPTSDIAQASFDRVAEMKLQGNTVSNQEKTKTDLKNLEQQALISERTGEPLPLDWKKNYDDAQEASDIANGLVPDPVNSGDTDDPGTAVYFRGSLIDPESATYKDTPGNLGESVVIGSKGYAFIHANDINVQEIDGQNPRFNIEVDGVFQELTGSDYLEALDAWSKYKQSLQITFEETKQTIISELGGTRAIELEAYRNKFDEKQSDINRRWEAAQADLTRAISTGNLEESIRSNKASELIARERDKQSKQQFAMTLMFQIASNPAALFFMRQSGMVGQLATMMGIDQSVFSGPKNGPADPLNAFNLQSWGQLTQEQRKIAMYSMQMQTGLSEAEINQKIQETSPGSITGQITRSTFGN